jgi:AcrR family transcriptional regulator
LSPDDSRKTTRRPRKRAEGNVVETAKGAKAAGEKTPVKASRGNRSRENTRRKLIEAAQRVMSEKGVEQTTIADITEAADVGFGSFYNHFSSKEDIVSTIATLRAQEFITMVRKIMCNETDIAVALSFNIKAFLSKAVADPIWGWFVIRTQGMMPEIDALFSNEIRSDLNRAVAEAGLDIHVETATKITFGALFGVLRPLLEKTMPISAIQETSECLLKLYGVAHDRARQISALPLPQYLIEPGK